MEKRIKQEMMEKGKKAGKGVGKKAGEKKTMGKPSAGGNPGEDKNKSKFETAKRYLSPEENKEAIRKVTERKQIKGKLRNSEAKVSPHLVAETKKVGEEIRGERIISVTNTLQDPKDNKVRDKTIKMLENTKIFVAEQRIWVKETGKISVIHKNPGAA
jgi:hypothetical protein